MTPSDADLIARVREALDNIGLDLDMDEKTQALEALDTLARRLEEAEDLSDRAAQSVEAAIGVNAALSRRLANAEKAWHENADARSVLVSDLAARTKLLLQVELERDQAQRRIEELREGLEHTVAEENTMPHGHRRPATWDDNGKPCQRCLMFEHARSLLHPEPQETS